jgi:hypothetical protein
MICAKGGSRKLPQCIFPEALNVSPDHQTLVRDGFAKIVPICTTAASLFYHRLFELKPQLRSPV